MTPWVSRLFFANIGAFFLQMLSPGLVNAFVFVPRLALVRPWTLVTYMFLHGGLMHLLFNMLALYFFGPRVEERLGSRRFVQLYFVSGVAGGVLSFLLAPYAAIVGASAAIFGVMLAFATFWPHAQILIWGILPVQARWLVVITTVLALWSGFSGSRGGVADFAHLGGYAGAFLYLRAIDPERRRKRFRQRSIGGTGDRVLTNWKRVDMQKVHELNRDEVNRILDKINETGLASLTPEERLFLSNFGPPDDRAPPVA
ncbi:MAG: hypothetical protein A3K13_00170 [Gemmatimonadetes bacterium RIFCSPLOWO2_12_FULL_68_9]|nr:MAG: hypothetical protein A3K13_00170 [Gemmatimonadetes bacterium RIFCSPLOWO2_12_FULL_68_9]